MFLKFISKIKERCYVIVLRVFYSIIEYYGLNNALTGLIAAK